MWSPKNCWIFFFGVSAIAFANAQLSNHARIINGVTTTIAAEPYMIHLLLDNYPLCGGSILSAKWVLTAAHCVPYKDEPERFKIRAGTTYLTGNAGETRDVVEIAVHPSFDKTTLIADLAMLYVNPLTLNGKTIKPIALCSKAVPSGVKVKVSGWGYTKANGTPSNQLRTVYVSTIALAACQKQYNNLKARKLTKMTICTTKKTKGFCSGDSGGALVYKNEVCGTVSWSAGCDNMVKPGVFTNVMNLKPFITKTMQSK